MGQEGFNHIAITPRSRFRGDQRFRGDPFPQEGGRVRGIERLLICPFVNLAHHLESLNLGKQSPARQFGGPLPAVAYNLRFLPQNFFGTLEVATVIRIREGTVPEG